MKVLIIGATVSRRWLRILLRREAPMEKARRAAGSARRISRQLAKRPFSDQHSHDNITDGRFY